MPVALFNPYAKSVFFDAEVRAEYEIFKSILHQVRHFTIPDFIPDLVAVEGQYKLCQPLALECIRSYHSMAHSLIRSFLIIVSKADNALVAHKEWLRRQYHEELRVGISTKINKIRIGVFDVQEKREDLAELRETLEELEEDFLANARDAENRALEHTADGLVDWDIHGIRMKIERYSELLLDLFTR